MKIDPQEFAEEIPEERLDLDTELERARIHFEAAEYHEAHEVLDIAWMQTHGPDGDFLKGLIQACIAMHHYRRGNDEGAIKLYAGHRKLLADYLPSHRGHDVQALLAEMQRVLARVVRVRPGTEPPKFEHAARPRWSAPGA